MEFLHRYYDDRFAHGFLGNSWERWAATGFLTLAILILTLSLRGLLLVRLRKIASRTGTQWQDVVRIALERTTYLFLFVVAVHFGTQSLELHDKIGKLRDYAFFFFFFYQMGLWLTSALEFYGRNYFRETLSKEPARATTISTMILLGDVAVWVLMTMLLLANYGVNISALVAGLGVGGVAVALALQSILGDVFASLAIVLDKPFVIGDSINVNDLTGTVENIGLKTTRIRSITGEQIVFANADLLKNVVKNFKRMERRRVTFTFNLEYETPARALNRARELVKAAIEPQKDATFERCYLVSLALASLDFEAVYWMETADYAAYVNAHHEILVRLIASFEKEGIGFAAPPHVPLSLRENSFAKT